MQYVQKLDELEARFEDLTAKLADPAVINEPDLYRKAAKSHSELSEVVAKYREWKRVDQDLAGARLMLEEHDEDLREMAAAEVERLEPEQTRLEEELKILLLPKDPNDDKDIVLEIRAGAGGDEASLFAAEVFRMYSRYAEEHRWRVELTSSTESSAGGMKEVICLIEGKDVCRVDVAAADRPVFVGVTGGARTADFHLRVGNATRKPLTAEVLDYQERRWG